MTTLSLLCAVLLGLMPTDPAATSISTTGELVSASDASVMKVYDITGLTQGPVAGQVALDLFPFKSSEAERDGKKESIEFAETIESLVYEVVAPGAFEYEGRSFTRLGNDKFVVVAPPGLQERIGALIDGLRAAFGRTATVGLDIYEVTSRDALPDVIDPGNIEALVKSGALHLVHAQQEQVRMGYTERLEALNSTRILGNWEAEIAQHATIKAPEISELFTGVDLLLRVEDVPGSSLVRLRHALSVSELRDLGSRSSADYSSVAAGDTRHITKNTLSQDYPVVSTTLSSGSSVLDVGDGIVSVGQCETLEGAAGWLSHLRVLHVDPMPAPMEFYKMSVAVVDVSAPTWSALELPVVSSSDLAGMKRRDPDELFNLLASSPDGKRPLFPSENMNDWGDAFSESASGLSMPELPWEWKDSSWVIWAAPSEDLEQNLALLSALSGVRKNLVVELSVSSDDEGAEVAEMARGRLTLESGGTGCLLFGELLVVQNGYDVEVATGASTLYGGQNSVFDGLYVQAAADGTGDSIQLSVASARLQDLEDVPASSVSSNVFTRPTFSLADVLAKVPADGKRRAVAELNGPLDGEGARTLWVAVHAR
jgi:hypothetical protein